MHLFKLTDEQITQLLIPKRFVPPTPQEHEGKNMVYVFDSDDKFERLCCTNLSLKAYSTI